MAHVIPGIAESMWTTDCTASSWSKSIETSYAITIKSIFSQDPEQNGFAKTSIKKVAAVFGIFDVPYSSSSYHMRGP